MPLALIFGLVLPVPLAPLDNPYEEFLLPRVRWINPAISHSDRVLPGVFAQVGGLFSEYQGRRSEGIDGTLGWNLSERVTLWASTQDQTVFGRSRPNRFDFDAATYGARFVIFAPNDDSKGLAVEFELTRGSTGVARTANSRATYPGVEVLTLGLTKTVYSGLIYSFTGSLLNGASIDGRTFAIGVGKDFRLNGRADFRLQGSLVAQGTEGLGDEIEFETKPVVFAALGYELGRGLRLETDVTFMPSGTPFAYGRLTPLTSYQIYRPGGAAEGLRSDTFALGALRLSYKFRF